MDRQIELQLLAQLAEQTALLREILELQRARLPEPAPPDERLANLLAAAACVLDSDESFSSVSLAEAGLSSISGAAALTRAINAICGKNPKGGVRRLGNFLAKHAGSVAGGYRLARLVKPGSDTPRYQVSRVSNRQNPGGSLPPRDNEPTLKEKT